MAIDAIFAVACDAQKALACLQEAQEACQDADLAISVDKPVIVEAAREMANCRNCGAPHDGRACGYCGTSYSGAGGLALGLGGKRYPLGRPGVAVPTLPPPPPARRW